MRQLLKSVFAPRDVVLCGVAALCVGMAGGKAVADPSPVVVELFTSQGCSSCPPADELLAKLAQRDDVIALALHVDYWDYIGWADVFARPEHTARQKGYAMAAGTARIYTPQMVIGGTDQVVGSRPIEVADLLQTHAGKDHGVELKVARATGTVRIQATRAAPQGTSDRMLVQVVRYTPLQNVEITRGENAGQELPYANVVRSWATVGEWDGATPFDVTAQVDGADPVVVLVQDGAHGPILAAAELR